MVRLMALLSRRGHWGRRVPLWIRCLALGLAISWGVAMGHWLLVEAGEMPRFRTLNAVDVDSSGVDIVEKIHRAANGLPRRMADPPGQFMRYEAVAYGWPIANWGSVFRKRDAFYWQTGVDAIVALDVRPLWPPADLPDPYRPALTRAQAAAICAAGGPCPTTLFYDPYQRYLPVFPLVGHSMLASVLYGVPFFVYFRVRESRRRRGHCARCGYDCSTLPGGAPCPECGVPRLRGQGRASA